MERYMTATVENIDDIINLRIMYLVEYNKGLKDEIINELKINMKEYLKEHLNKDCFIEIAYNDNKIISSAILNIVKKVPSPRFLNGVFGELYGVYTNPNYRNKGIATNLVKRIIENTKNKNISFIQLGASEMGANIYIKCGFIYSNSEYKEMKYYFN